ncbi:MAG: TonB-dependent receptor, partial [Chitinophagaceae bacterium]|nr:TonB-dependent receptor [Chitinophagaceae bacterium]
MRIRCINILMLLCMLCPALLMAQQPAASKTVKGTILDSAGNALPGASITILGTSRGTTSDANGAFQLTAPNNGKLEISLLGYSTQTFAVADIDGPLTVKLTVSASSLDGVVVIGYGTIRKKDVTGAIQTIDGATLEKSMMPDATQALNGRVAGVNVLKTSNRPGAGFNVQVRGTNSFNFSNEPLYVIDGIPTTNGMRYLNPSDIESIDVLKDASSSAIYGSRGSNGVVIITTKGAKKKDGFDVNFNGYAGIKVPARIPDMIGSRGDGLEYVDYRIALWTNKYGPSSLSRPDFLTPAEKERVRYGEYYDWSREVLKSGLIHNHSINASGGSEKTSYTFGMGYFDEEGITGRERFKRMTANLGIEHRMSSKIKLGFNSYGSKVNIDEGSAEALINAYFLPPIVSPYDANGNMLFKVQPTSSKVNPLIDMENDIREREEYYANIAGFIEVSPIKDLSIKSQFASQFDTYTYGTFKGLYTQANSGVNPPSAYKATGKSFNWVWDNIITWKKNIGKEHKIHAIGLFSIQKDQHESSQMRGEGLPYNSGWHAIQTADQITGVESNYWESAMVSFMGRVNYTYKGKYLLTLTTRYDGTSRLAKNNRWGMMPSAALGWQLSEEDFMKGISFVNDLKLRLSYGLTGNNNVRHDVTHTRLSMSRYLLGDKGTVGFGLGNEIGNPNLKWEMTSELNAGLDFGLFRNRIRGSLDVYKRITRDLIFERKVANINGYSSFLENIGSTSNEGIELGLSTVNVSTKNFTWKTDLTFSKNRNKIRDLYGDKKDDIANRWFIGQPMKVIYDYKFLGIWQTSEKAAAAPYGKAPGHIKIEDRNDDKAFDERDMVILGTPNPDWTGGITNTFTYKNWDLSAFVYIRKGGLYDDPFTFMFTAWDNEHWNKLDVNYWTPENGSNEYPGIGAVSLHTQVLSKVKGTFVKIQNLTAGYTFEAEKLKRVKMKNLRIYGTVNNPFTFSKYLGSDPESIGEDPYSTLSIMPMSFT